MIDFKDEGNRRVLKEWWASLQEHRGERAELRRAGTLTEVAFMIAYHRLLQGLEKIDPKVRREGVAALAAVGALLEEIDARSSVAKQMATGTDKAPVSLVRFRRLLAAEGLEELFPQLRRALALLDHKANFYSLAEALLRWNDMTRKHWAHDYYAASPEKP